MDAIYAPQSEGLLTPLTPWLTDNEVSEIMLNSPQEVWIEKKGQMQCVKVDAYNERMLANLFQLIANENHQEINGKHPLLSGSLLDGSRIQLVLAPTAKHFTFAIRRKVVRELTLANYAAQDYYRQGVAFDIHGNSFDLLPDSEQSLVRLFHTKKWGDFISHAISLRKNIVISGGTSSGKTTFLNACLREIDLQDRLLILEDTREIDTPHPNQVQLLASKGDQGEAKVNMQDLVQCCLRLRPDRIIMGEIRGQEIMDFISACSTGHEGSITTIHANNPRVAFMRMTQMYKLNNVPSMSDEDIMRQLSEVIDIIIQITKTSAGRLMSSIYYKHMDVMPSINTKKRQLVQKNKKIQPIKEIAA